MPVEVAYRHSFVDGIGASFIIPAQFYRLKDMLSGALTVTPEQIAEAVSFLALSEKLIAEGAGAAALAAARQYSGMYGWKNPCCSKHDLLLWDNRCTQHLAVADAWWWWDSPSKRRWMRMS